MALKNYSVLVPGNTVTQLWPAATAGTGFGIQNASRTGKEVVVEVTCPDSTILQVILPKRGDYVDDTDLDPTLAMSVLAFDPETQVNAWRTGV